VYWGDWHFWAFNVADAAITVGVVFMILDLLKVRTSGVSRAV
jgi:lipoprotein signal peptidase